MPRNPVSELQSEKAVSSPVRRSSRIVNSPVPDLSVKLTRTRRTSIDSATSSVASEKDEKPAALRSRRTSTLSENDPKEVTASPRRGRPKIEKNEKPEPVKTRRASAQKESEKQIEPVKATRGRRGSIQKEDTPSKAAAPRTRNSSKEEIKEEPKRTLRTRKPSIEKEVTAEKEKKPRGRRSSTESTESVATPSKVTRRTRSGSNHTPEKSNVSEDEQPELSIKVTPIGKKAIKNDVTNLSTIDEDAIDSDQTNQEKSPRKSPRLLLKSKTDSSPSTSSNENVLDEDSANEVKSSSPKILSPLKRKLSMDSGSEPVQKSPRKSIHKVDDNHSLLVDGKDGSFTFHLNESLEESIINISKECLNVSINSNSDKENTSPLKKSIENQEGKSDIVRIKDTNEFTEDGIDRSKENVSCVVQQSTAEPLKRISNVFRPKHKECSFLEPMEIDFNDTNMVANEIDDDNSEKSPEMDKSIDLVSNFKRSDSSASSEFELEVKSEDEGTTDKISQGIEKSNTSDQGKHSLNKSSDRTSEHEINEVFELPLKSKPNAERNQSQDVAEDERFKSQLNKTEETLSDIENGLKQALAESDVRKNLSNIEKKINEKSMEVQINKNQVDYNEKSLKKSLEISLSKSDEIVENPVVNEETEIDIPQKLVKSTHPESSPNKNHKSLNNSQQNIDESSVKNKNADDNKALSEHIPPKKYERTRFTRLFEQNLQNFENSFKNTVVMNAAENDLKFVEIEKSHNKNKQDIEKCSTTSDNDVTIPRKSTELKNSTKKARKSGSLVENQEHFKNEFEESIIAESKSDKKRKSLNKSLAINEKSNNMNISNVQKTKRKSKNVSDDQHSDKCTSILNTSKEFKKNVEDNIMESQTKPEKKGRDSTSKNVKSSEFSEGNQLQRKNDIESKNTPKKETNKEENETLTSDNEQIINRKRKSDTNLESPPKKLQNLSANSKLDDYLTMKLQDVDSDEEDASSNCSEKSDNFIDDMAAEVEEDTPSEDSNEIIDVGESVGSSDSDLISDEEYEHDSFVCDDEEEKLLSGAEYDLSIESKTEKKKSKIIDISQDSSDEDETKVYLIGQNAKQEKVKKEEEPKIRKRIMTASDSSDEEVDIDELLDIKQEDNKLESTTKLESPVTINIVNDGKKRKSSITIIENISVDEVKDEPLKQRISQLVENFTTNCNKGEIAVNLSLEFTEINNESTSLIRGNQRVQEIVKISPNKEKIMKNSSNNKSISASDSLSVPDLDVSGTNTDKDKNNGCVLSKPNATEIVSPSKDIQLEKVAPEELEISTNDYYICGNEENSESEQEVLFHKKKYNNKFNTDIQNKLKTQMKPSRENKLKFNKNKELKIKEMASDLQKKTTNVWNQLVTDVKKRSKRTIKPSTTNNTDSKWVTEEINKKVRPSTSLLTKKEKADSKFTKFHPKDFKNQMLYDSNRIKRMDSQGLNKKKGLK